MNPLAIFNLHFAKEARNENLKSPTLLDLRRHLSIDHPNDDDPFCRAYSIFKNWKYINDTIC